MGSNWQWGVCALLLSIEALAQTPVAWDRSRIAARVRESAAQLPAQIAMQVIHELADAEVSTASSQAQADYESSFGYAMRVRAPDLPFFADESSIGGLKMQIERQDVHGLVLLNDMQEALEMARKADIPKSLIYAELIQGRGNWTEILNECVVADSFPYEAIGELVLPPLQGDHKPDRLAIYKEGDRIAAKETELPAIRAASDYLASDQPAELAPEVASSAEALLVRLTARNDKTHPLADLVSDLLSVLKRLAPIRYAAILARYPGLDMAQNIRPGTNEADGNSICGQHADFDVPNAESDPDFADTVQTAMRAGLNDRTLAMQLAGQARQSLAREWDTDLASVVQLAALYDQLNMKSDAAALRSQVMTHLQGIGVEWLARYSKSCEDRQDQMAFDLLSGRPPVLSVPLKALLAQDPNSAFAWISEMGEPLQVLLLAHALSFERSR